MSFRPSTKPIKQDMPPPGGYPKINFMETMRARGPNGAMIWGGAVACLAYGFYSMAVANGKMKVEEHYKRETRLTMAPFLQAESDLSYLARRKKILEHEAKIMGDVEGWTVGESVYFNKDRWVPDEPFKLMRHNKK